MVNKLWLLVGGLIVAAVFTLSVIPLPNNYNVQVVVNSTEFAAVVVVDYKITSVTATTQGHSTVLNWATASIATGSANAVYTMKTCVGPICSTLSGDELFPSIPVANGASFSQTNMFTLGYVPGGQQPVTVTLTITNQLPSSTTVVTGSGQVCVGC